jgi:hypothetical protein
MSIFVKSKQTQVVRVRTVDTVLEFSITPNTIGQELFDQVRHAADSRACAHGLACS